MGTNFLRTDIAPDLFKRDITTGISLSVEKSSRFTDASLPTGCIYCRKGLKLPVYITMKCNLRCRYCPIDPNLLKSDICIVGGNVIEDKNIITALCKTNVSGISISGGEPLLRINEVLRLIESLKKNYGKKFHIHMYTNATLLTKDLLFQLESSGLDEIRPSSLDTRQLLIFEGSKIEVTLETVALNYRKCEIKKAITAASKIGINGIILTEAEINKFNKEKIGEMTTCSLTTANEIKTWAREADLYPNISICSKSNAYESACKREENLASFSFYQ